MHHRNTVRLVRKVFLVALFLSFYFMTPSAFTGSLQADNTLVKVYGRVTDAKTHQPIPNASVVFGAVRPEMGRGPFIMRTNASGIYEVNVTGGKDYFVFASSEFSPFTLGINYVPACRRISVANELLNVSFALLPGACISIIGIFYPPTLDPAPINWQRFYVIDKFGLLDKTDAIREFTVDTRGFTFAEALGLGKAVPGVILPADMPVKVRGEIHYLNRSIVYLTIDCEGDYLNLTQGSLTTINLHALWLSKNPDYVTARLQRVRGTVDKAEEKGFYVSRERGRVSRAENLIENAYAKTAEGDHDASYADLYEALLILKDVEESFQGFYLNASQSVFLITPLLAFTAVALVSSILEKWRRKLAASLILYAVLFGLLYLLFPGYGALQGVYNPWAGTSFENLLLPLLVVTSFVVASFLVLGLPYTVKERTSMEELRLMSAIATAFATAARNLKCRRLRTLLTSSLMLISIFAFITLTSFSAEYGFIIQSKPGQAPSEGFLLRYHRPGYPGPWDSIDPAVLHWLKERPETALLVPKVENWPSTGEDVEPPPLTSLYAPKTGSSFNVSGVLGVYPSLEVQVTKMDTIIVQGSFLKDGDLNGILISEWAAQKLQIELNNTVQLWQQNFTVIGIFNGEKLDQLKDLDGESLVPWKITITHPPMGEPEYRASRVRGEEVVIIHGETAEGLPQMAISRVDVQTKSPEEIVALARLAVLYWPNFRAFASTATGIHSLFIGSYSVIMGFAEAMVPLALVVLNMGVMMLSAVYERRREIFTMSSVGLNPSHITAVFVAEALVIGVVAGSLGYFLGLASYRLMVVFMPLEVKQKVEAIWAILALCLSIGAAVLGTAIPALKAALIATPSLLRKWRIKVEEKPRGKGEPWLLKMPLRVRKEDLEDFFGFMEKRLHGYTLYPYWWIENVKVSKADKPTATRLSFTYVFSEENIATENDLFLVKDLLPNRYTVTLSSKTRRGTITSRDEADVRQTASFIRRLILQYTSERHAREG